MTEINIMLLVLTSCLLVYIIKKIKQRRLLTGQRDLLNSWGDRLGVSRSYYGDDKDVKPNRHCFWDKYAYIVGWYETDDHMRGRVVARFSSKPVASEEYLKDVITAEFPDVAYEILEDQIERTITIVVTSGDCEAIRQAALRVTPAVWFVDVRYGVVPQKEV